jgi:hypothetical protein
MNLRPPPPTITRTRMRGNESLRLQALVKPYFLQGDDTDPRHVFSKVTYFPSPQRRVPRISPSACANCSRLCISAS